MEWSICRESIPTLNTHTHLYHTLTFLGVVVFSQYYFGMTRTKCVLFPMDGVPSNKKVAWHTYLQATIGHGRDLSSTTKLCLSDVSFLLFYCFLSRLFLAISLIISFIQQVIKIDGIRHFNLDKPSLIFCRFIDNTRIVYRLGVDFHHSTRNGRVHIRSESPISNSSPTSGKLIKTMSPSSAWAKSVMPQVPMSPSTLTYS
jgi:hypothetical protein